jgi:hypothetical protein
MTPQNNNLSYWQRAENAQWILRFAALTVMPWLRDDIGYRLLNPVHILCMNGSLALLGLYMQPIHPDQRPALLTFFAVCTLILSIAQRAKRARAMKRGVHQHTYYIGTSMFDFRWLPESYRRNRIAARVFDPPACILAGLFCLQGSKMLGGWLIICGFTLRIYEDAVRRDRIKNDLDLLDGLITPTIRRRRLSTTPRRPPLHPSNKPPASPPALHPISSDIFSKEKPNKKTY